MAKLNNLEQEYGNLEAKVFVKLLDILDSSPFESVFEEYNDKVIPLNLNPTNGRFNSRFTGYVEFGRVGKGGAFCFIDDEGYPFQVYEESCLEDLIAIITYTETDKKYLQAVKRKKTKIYLDKI